MKTLCAATLAFLVLVAHDLDRRSREHPAHWAKCDRDHEQLPPFRGDEAQEEAFQTLMKCLKGE